MSNISTPATKPTTKWQRKIKLPPGSIANMTSADSHCLVMSEELDPHSKSKTYGKSLRVVSRVKCIGQNDEDISGFLQAYFFYLVLRIGYDPT